MRNIPSIFEIDKVTKMNLLFKISDVAQLVQKLERNFDRNFDLTKRFFFQFRYLQILQMTIQMSLTFNEHKDLLRWNSKNF